MTSNKRSSQSESTKQSIIEAAETLFTTQGYNHVTMRQIAKQAGCSHTTIYIYFKDKEALLHALSIPLIAQLHEQFSLLLLRSDLSAKEMLVQISEQFILFCLNHRQLFTLLFFVEAERIDESGPVSPLNRQRIQLFDQLKQALQQCFRIEQEDELLQYSRIYFYLLHGIIGTYVYSEESLHDILDRLLPTFREAIDSLIRGMELKLKRS